MTGIRSWIGWVSSLAAVVTMAAVSVQLLCILPKTSNRDGEPIATRDVKGLLRTTGKFLPLVVSTGGNDAAPALKGIAERGLA